MSRHLRPARSSARHVFTAIGFQVAGELELEQGGPVALRSGDIHIIPAGHAHRFVRATDAQTWHIALLPEQLDRQRFADVLAPLAAVAEGSASPRITIAKNRRAFVTSLFHELAEERARSPLRRESLVALLLTEIAEHAVARIAAPPVQPVDLAARAVAFIAANALSPLSLEDVARSLGRHRAHVADVVRRATGRTVGELIAEVRLDEARRRLEDTDELVEIIGERVGYTDATHFARMFKRRYGAAPRAWRTRTATH